MTKELLIIYLNIYSQTYSYCYTPIMINNIIACRCLWLYMYYISFLRRCFLNDGSCISVEVFVAYMELYAVQPWIVFTLIASTCQICIVCDGICWIYYSSTCFFFFKVISIGVALIESPSFLNSVSVLNII